MARHQVDAKSLAEPMLTLCRWLAQLINSLVPGRSGSNCKCVIFQHVLVVDILNISYKINSLAPGRFQINIRKVIFKLTLVNGGWDISYEIALRWMPQDLTDDKSTLVQVMA